MLFEISFYIELYMIEITCKSVSLKHHVWSCTAETSFTQYKVELRLPKGWKILIIQSSSSAF